MNEVYVGAKTAAVGAGKLLIVWNDLGIRDELDERPGILRIDSEAAVRDVLMSLTQDPAFHADMLDRQIAGREAEGLPPSATDAVIAQIRATVRGPQLSGQSPEEDDQ